MKKVFVFFICVTVLLSCDQYDEVPQEEPSEEINVGSGIYQFNYPTTSGTIEMQVYYHIPNADLTNMPVLFVLHGASRNAIEYRNAWIDEANEKEFIVITPKFSSEDFPGGDAYNLGNVFEDGDHPSTDTLNDEQDWSYSIIESLFYDFKLKSGNTSTHYNLFGFSAGAQFAHRFVMFKPNASVNKVIASAAGWYTTTNDDIEFPYGIGNCPIENNANASYFSVDMTIQIGTLDNNPNASSLRRNSIVDIQGTNRYDRAYYMFNTSQTKAQSLGVNFNWNIIETIGNDHDNRGAIEQAVEIFGY